MLSKSSAMMSCTQTYTEHLAVGIVTYEVDVAYFAYAMGSTVVLGTQTLGKIGRRVCVIGSDGSV